jgi:hypothetical protein
MPINLVADEGLGTGQHMSTIMALYFFRIGHGQYSGASDQGSEFESREAAWAEMTRVCGELLGSISRKLRQNGEWHMELLDEAKKPLFRIRLLAETLG